ncbi:MAG: GAF domain-containing protein [Betaproteobacteria bacterium]|nr:GAF domain-containing protein [Betaproteobacteria bacterium]MCC6248259.1 GAF domain-containing protein [Rubrivivax sp.]MCL4697116.1 GAF domain-containing protein [Burkholderiaceae bacterium]
MALDLDAIRACLEGAIPAVMATCDTDGTPNVTYLSQAEYVDAQHLALSFQFFNKTRHNVLANPVVELLVIHPVHGAMYRINARYLRTETDGALFERMKAKLAGIASHTGMSGVFKLRGADLYAVDRVEPVALPRREVTGGGLNRLSALRRSAQRVADSSDLESLVERLLDAVVDDFGIRHVMLLMLDAAGQRLYTVGSRGYGRSDSGAGSEVPLGDGVIGVAAQHHTPIRINHATREYAYIRTMREGLPGPLREREIPLPGLAEPGSQLAVPLACAGQLVGALFVESAHDMRFTWDDEDALAALAAQAAALARGFQAGAETPDDEASTAEALRPAATPAKATQPAPLRVRHYEADGSVFLDDDYVIKGVAGAVLWKLLRDHASEGRTEFSNRELRLSPEIGLPEVGDNLEARLVLLTRRLVDRQASAQLLKTGRGRFRLQVSRPLQLVNVPR